MRPVDRRVVGWRIWYRADTEGGAYFDSSTTDWRDLPELGVLQLVVYFADGRRMTLGGQDYYWIEKGGDGQVAYCSDKSNSAILPEGDPSAIKRGKWTSGTEMADVEAKARAATTAPI